MSHSQRTGIECMSRYEEKLSQTTLIASPGRAWRSASPFIWSENGGGGGENGHIRFFLKKCIQGEMSGEYIRSYQLMCLFFSTLCFWVLTVFAFAALPEAREIILMSQEGQEQIDVQIAKLQKAIKRNPDRAMPLVERLGWLFVAKARVSNDPGFYKLAEQCALVMVSDKPKSPEALMLSGHIMHEMHRFHDAERVGRELVLAEPDRWQSHAVLGDALMEQGELGTAVGEYQKMIDIRPCAQTYSRVAHMRWLKGDLDGAINMMRLSVEAGDTHDPEPAAWAYSRLAFYQLQAGDQKSANWSIDRQSRRHRSKSGP